MLKGAVNNRVLYIPLSYSLATICACLLVSLFCLPAHASADNSTVEQIPVNITAKQALQPVSRVDSYLPGKVVATDEIRRVTSFSRDLKHINGARVFSENSLSMSAGKILFTPNRDIRVITTQGQTFISAGAIVLIDVFEETTVVYNFHDNQRSDVWISLAGKNYEIVPGSMLSATQDLANSSYLANPEHISTRAVQRVDLGKDLTVHTAEFSLMQSLIELAPFRQARAEKTAADKQLMAKLYKTAAIIKMLSTKHEPFSTSGR